MKETKKKSQYESTKNYTKITYYPDFVRFGLTDITTDIQSIFLKRAIDIAAYNPDIKVYYNDTLTALIH